MANEVQQKYEGFCNLLEQILKSNCPVDTGNMKTHIRIQNDGLNCKIIIDTIPYFAPKSTKGKKQIEYASNTEYAWSKGKNPNQGWVRKSILEAAQNIGDIINCLIEVD